MGVLRAHLFDSVYDWMLENELTPYILVDVSSESVSVPREHVQDGRIILNIHPRSIDGLVAKDEELSFLARFNGRSRPIIVPFHSLLALYSRETNQGIVFQGDSIASEILTETRADPEPTRKARRPELRLVT